MWFSTTAVFVSRAFAFIALLLLLLWRLLSTAGALTLNRTALNVVSEFAGHAGVPPQQRRVPQVGSVYR